MRAVAEAVVGASIVAVLYAIFRALVAGGTTARIDWLDINGKAVVALACDPAILDRTGGSYWSSRLAREYGFSEDDGSLPPEMANGLATLMDAEDIPAFWRGVDRYAGSKRT